MPAALVTTHLRAMLKGPLADRLTISGVTVGCYYDDAQHWVDDGTGHAVPSRARSALILTGAIPGLVEQQPATLRRTDTGATTALTVFRVAPEDDGLLTRVWLA